jgi:hypothetical protein
MRCRIVGQQNADVDPNIEDFDERMPHGLFVPDAEVKCLECRTKPIGHGRQHATIRVSSTTPGARDTFNDDAANARPG